MKAFHLFDLKSINFEMKKLLTSLKTSRFSIVLNFSAFFFSLFLSCLICTSSSGKFDSRWFLFGLVVGMLLVAAF